MPAIGNSVSSSEQLCVRCNSKKRVAKTWTERLKNDHGVMILTHKKIVCTNKKCQADFEKVIIEDTEKRAKLYQIKLDNIARRVALKPPPAAS